VFATMLICSRSLTAGVWESMFVDLLNIRSCSEIPDLMTYRKQLVAILERRVTARQLNSYVGQLQQQLGS